MNGLALGGAVAAYAKLNGASASAESLMEKCLIQTIRTKPQRNQI